MKSIQICLIVMAFFGIFSFVQQYEYNVLSQKIEELKSQKEEAEAYENKLRDELAQMQEYARSLKKKMSMLSGVQPGISREHVRRVITATLAHLGVKPQEQAAWEKLLLLTAATESDMGRILRQIRGPARGIFQVEPNTEKYVLWWFKTFDPTVYEKIKNLRCPAKLDIAELEGNLPYAVAIAWGTYAVRKVNPVGKSLQEMAEMYKRHYNTPKGKASVKGALQKAQVFAKLS